MSQKNSAKYRIEVSYKKEDPRGDAVKEKFSSLGFSIDQVSITDNYLVNIDFNKNDINSAALLLTQPVTQEFRINTPFIPGYDFNYCIEIGFLPGVTDNISHTVRESFEDLFKSEFDSEKSVFYTTSFFLKGNISEDDAQNIGKELYNPLIQRIKIFSADEYRKNEGMGYEIPVVNISENPDADLVNLSVPDDELQKIGKEGIADEDGTRRGPLALDMASMNVIKDYFINKEKRNPTDIELESIAQTWSEHCKHTIFAAAIDDDTPGGIYKTYIREATVRIRREKGERYF